MPRSARATVAILAAICFSFLEGCNTGGKVASSQSADHSSVALTIYSTANPAEFDPQSVFLENGTYRLAPGYGVVRDTRQFSLEKGVNHVEVTNIAAWIDPTTVSFRSLSDPAGAAVLEQNLENDTASPDTVLRRYLDKEVVLRVAGKGEDATEVRGVLLSTAVPNGIGAAYVIRTGGKDGPVTVIDASRVVSISLANTGGRVVSKPTLTWMIDSERAGKQDVEIAYQTDGLTWRADYGLLLSPDETTADLSAWVSVVNVSGLTYPEAKLKLVAGKVHRLNPQRYQQQEGGGGGASLFGSARKESFDEKEFFEYHLYTLSRTSTLPDRSTKQIELFPERTKVPVEKTYMWLGPSKERNNIYAPDTTQDFNAADSGTIDIFIRLKNSRENGLGIPLPAGRVRLYKLDPADHTREFIGEDVIEHTPKDEAVLLSVGSAFDVVGSREQTKFEKEGNTVTESFTVSIRNRKSTPVKVTVREFMYRWLNWKILEASEKWSPVGVKAIDFKFDLAAGEEKKVTYTVKYSW